MSGGTGQLVWEKSRCPMCGENEVVYLYKFDPRVSTLPVPGRITTSGLGIVRCLYCSLVYLEYRPTQSSMEKIYASDRYFGCDDKTGYTDYAEQKNSLDKTFRLFLKNLSHHHGISGSLADIGCGNGYLLNAAESWFSLRVGSDMSQSAVDVASLVCDKTLRGGPQQIYEAGFFDFDLVTAVSVLEHLYNPLAFMHQCNLLLKPRGYLALAVPHFGSLWRKVMGRYWSSFKIPEHLSHWEKESLEQLGKRAGFQLVEFMPYHHYFPLSVVLDKIGITLSRYTGSLLKNTQIFLPSVMLTAVYRK